MQTALVILIVSLAALYWLNRFFPKIEQILWSGIARILKLIHAPITSQQWALKHCNIEKNSDCNSCSKCGGKCH